MNYYCSPWHFPKIFNYIKANQLNFIFAYDLALLLIISALSYEKREYCLQEEKGVQWWHPPSHDKREEVSRWVLQQIGREIKDEGEGQFREEGDAR